MKQNNKNLIKRTKSKTPPGKMKLSKASPIKMKPSKTPPINVIALRATDYSPNGKNVILSMTTKYSDERTYSVPVECLYGLIADLQKLKLSTAAPAIETSSQTAVAPKPAEDLNRVNVTVPKKWMLRSALPDHPFVVMVFDPQTKQQAGYALTVAAAKEMAVGLVKYADTVTTHVASKPNLS